MKTEVAVFCSRRKLRSLVGIESRKETLLGSTPKPLGQGRSLQIVLDFGVVMSSPEPRDNYGTASAGMLVARERPAGSRRKACHVEERKCLS